MKSIDQEFTQAVMTWFSENQRDLPWRKDQDPYHIWVSEIMLQQTRVEAVREYYRRWMEALPTVRDLAESEEETLLKLWQGLGYYNRVRNMQKAAKIIMEEHDGKFPGQYDEIRKLPGIGDYTAGAISSNCFDERVAAIDGNVLRVMSRLTEDDSDILKQSTRRRYAQMLAEIYPPKDCGKFTQGMIEIGAIVCVPNGLPKCEICPIRAFCGAAAHRTFTRYPVKAAKKERKLIEMTVFILQCGDKIAVQKRDAKGILAGLYQYPNLERRLTAAQAMQQAEAWGCMPTGLQRQSEYKHIFTHVEWYMTGYYITCDSETDGPAQDWIWANAAQMEAEIPLPSAFQYF